MSEHILAYLYGYLKWMRNEGIPNYIVKNNTRNMQIMDTAQNYVRKHSEYAGILNGGCPKKFIGGGKILQNLLEMQGAIRSLQTTDTSKQAAMFAQIDLLMKNIEEKLSTNPHIVHDVTEFFEGKEMIQSTMNLLKVGLTSLDDITSHRSTEDLRQQKFPVQKLVKFSDKELYNFNNIFDEYNKKIDGIIDTDQENMQKQNMNFENLHGDILKQINEFAEKGNALNTSISELDQFLTGAGNDLVYAYDESEIKFVKKFDVFLDDLQKAVDESNPKPVDAAGIVALITATRDRCSGQIEYFNDNAIKYISQIRHITGYGKFKKYYDGINNTRINNAFFSDKDLIDVGFVKKLVGDFVVSKEKEQKLSGNEFKKMLIEFPKALIGNVLSGGRRRKNMRGGASVDDIKKLISEQGELYQAVWSYNQLANKYNKKLHDNQEDLINNAIHNLFLVMVATNQMLTNGYVVHEYIQRGALSLYERILRSMLNDMTNNPEKEINIYLSKCHAVTIQKLHSFVGVLSSQLNEMKVKKMALCKSTEMHNKFAKACVDACTPPKCREQAKECEGDYTEPCRKKKERECLFDDIIDINACSGNTANMFLLLNHFKGIIMNYNVLSGNKITIYARVNDLGDEMNPSSKEMYEKMMYVSDYDYKLRHPDDTTKIDVSKLYINEAACPKKPEEKTDAKQGDVLKFTEVFDSTQFSNSSEISKYMTIDTLLSQANGLGMMTYGYSGTGKSFILFGDAKNNIPGILQTTLNDVNGLKSVYLRVIELYGLGLPFPHYWEKQPGRTIDQCLYAYNIQLIGTEMKMSGDVTQIVGDENIKRFMASTPKGNTYYNIAENSVSSVFKNFNNFVDEIDAKRKEAGRIRNTPNNPVSSRSIVIYDFQLELFSQETYVPFLIVDLPGREEIIQTYVEPYLDNTVIQKLLGNQPPARINELKLILGFAALNPLGLALLRPDSIEKTLKNYFANTNPKTKMIEIRPDRQQEYDEIFQARNMEFTLDPNKMNDGVKNIKEDMRAKLTGIDYKIKEEPTAWLVNGNVTLSNEIINPKGGLLSLFFMIPDNNIFKATMIKKSTIDAPFFYKTEHQFKSILYIHIMNRLIIANKFKLLEKIIQEICDVEINNKITIAKINGLTAQDWDYIQSKNFKSLYWFEKPGGKEFKPFSQALAPEEKLKIFHYDYILTPFEGIYINENIIGLIKYLSATKMGIMDDNTADDNQKIMTLKETIHEQNKALGFQYQHKLARVWLSSAGTKSNINEFLEIDTTVPKLYGDDGIKLNDESVKKIFAFITESYKSDAIFNFDHPPIKDILAPYLGGLTFYNVLYLLANYKDNNKRTTKCGHQHKLLTNTRSFVEMISTIEEIHETP